MVRGVSCSVFLLLSSDHLASVFRPQEWGDTSVRWNQCPQLSQAASNGGENRISSACDQDRPSVGKNLDWAHQGFGS